MDVTEILDPMTVRHLRDSTDQVLRYDQAASRAVEAGILGEAPHDVGRQACQALRQATLALAGRIEALACALRRQ